MKRNIILTATTALLLTMDLGAQTTLTLDRCLEMALSGNSYAVNAALDLRAAEYQKMEATWEWLPKVSVVALGFHATDPLIEMTITGVLGNNDFSNNLQQVVDSYGAMYGIKNSVRVLDKGYGTMATLLQPVFAGGRIASGNKLASLGVAAARLQNEVQIRKTSSEIEELWWQVVSLEDKSATLDEVSLIVDTLASMVNSAIEAGLVPFTDKLQIDMRLKEVEAGRRQLRYGIRLARMNLFNSIGLEYAIIAGGGIDSLPLLDEIVLDVVQQLPLSPESYWKDEEEIASGMQERRLLDLQVQARSLEKKMAVGEAMPKIAVGASYGYSNYLGKGRMGGLAFATIQLPLTDWGKTVRKAQRLDIAVQKAENEREFFNRQLRLQVGKLWLDLVSAHDRWQIALGASLTARTLFDYQCGNYDAGLVSLSDLLEAQTSLAQARSEETDALIAYRNAVRAYTQLNK